MSAELWHFLAVAEHALAVITLWSIFAAVVLYFRGDRLGNSGRAQHWSENERLDGPDER